MEASTVTSDVVERANELYWGSETSVNQIAEELDLSKGALYALVEPLVSGLGCPLCGAEVAFSNRTAMDRGRLDCATCDWDGSAEETVALDEPATAAKALPVPAPPESLGDVRRRAIAGGALLGAAVGLALVMWARRR